MRPLLWWRVARFLASGWLVENVQRWLRGG
jgi:hypothetical protein